MSLVEREATPTSAALVRRAVHRNAGTSREGMLERVFAAAFTNLVYPQIWEDPVVDMEALAIEPASRIVTIASGGCNVLSYLIADPAHITAVDLNAHHIALNRLKLAAARHLSDHASFLRFFGRADDRANVEVFDRALAPTLAPATRAYWSGRGLTGRRRIERFARGFYRYGLLGRCIGTAHAVAKLHGVDPAAMMRARDRDEQMAIFELELAPLFEKRSIRWLLDRPMSLYGLGIPPAQFTALSAGRPMSEVVRERLRKLACDHDLAENYFAWQAFARRYETAGGPLPPYLHVGNFEALRSRVTRVNVRQITFTEHLAGLPPQTLDRYVLLDAQDWMSDADLNELWRQITRTARSGARVIFRTADTHSLLPGRVDEAILGQWRYEAARSVEFTERDRSAIYGGFHLYVLDRGATGWP
jgi:S-adenosylmethionine-diacylglycerol 3-amino-3-carboxypropyl transferase